MSRKYDLRVDILYDLDSLVEEMLSGEIGETNAYNFCLEDIEQTSCRYDPSNGMLTAAISFTYSGEQDPDRMYHSTAFYLSGTLKMFQKNSVWVLSENKPLDILQVESDQDRDYRAEQEY